ncbi:hypothetical protein PYV02_01010 [Leifsonia sp. H3M29-4]|uniref:hypothetical protein n=1 Tax=Salinibacterium metalliresistens TaxID=3031321 RepID=UPI0023DA0889|nr:hypothetical protein [Salinibacterium metalliresistens]MDF1477658.1 hypothetical protein [Salinibacterium metalliresistens]
MRRVLITWGVALAVVVAGFFGTVLVLGATVFSAGGFVGGYLDALARHDADGALELAGPRPEAGDASDELLVAAAMGELSDIRLIDDLTQPDGTHLVTYAYTAGGVADESAFVVRSSGALFGLFATWDFVTSPIGVLQVTPRNDPRFTANGVQVLAPAQDTATPYLVFTPSTTVLGHESTFLQADPEPATATVPGAAVAAAVTVRPNAAFVKQVQRELNDYLDECATQEVLLPTGCPFGEEITNRIISTPQWSIASYPQVTIVPGPEPLTWLMPRTTAAAHLVVEVRSLFDGTVSTFDEDVSFTTSYLITFLDDDELLITAQYE